MRQLEAHVEQVPQEPTAEACVRQEERTRVVLQQDRRKGQARRQQSQANGAREHHPFPGLGGERSRKEDEIPRVHGYDAKFGGENQ